MIKKEKRNKIIMGMIIIFLMVSSVLGFIYSGSNAKNINGFKFTNNGNSWQVWIEDLESYLYFNYLPDELNLDLDNLYFNSNSFDLVNVNWAEDNVQLLQTLLLYKNIQTQVLNSVEVCEDQTIILDSSGKAEIYNLDNCLYLKGDYFKILEAIKYKVFGVI